MKNKIFFFGLMVLMFLEAAAAENNTTNLDAMLSELYVRMFYVFVVVFCLILGLYAISKLTK
jgi:hypothetical protein